MEPGGVFATLPGPWWLWLAGLAGVIIWVVVFVRRLLRDPEAERRRREWSKPDERLTEEEIEAMLSGRPTKPSKGSRRGRR